MQNQHAFLSYRPPAAPALPFTSLQFTSIHFFFNHNNNTFHKKHATGGLARRRNNFSRRRRRRKYGRRQMRPETRAMILIYEGIHAERQHLGGGGGGGGILQLSRRGLHFHFHWWWWWCLLEAMIPHTCHRICNSRIEISLMNRRYYLLDVLCVVVVREMCGWYVKISKGMKEYHPHFAGLSVPLYYNSSSCWVSIAANAIPPVRKVFQ